MVGDTVYLLLLLPAAPFLQLEAEHHARTDVVEGQRIPVLKYHKRFLAALTGFVL